RLLVFEFATGPLPTAPVAMWNFSAPVNSDTRPSAIASGDVDGDGREELGIGFRSFSGTAKGIIITSVVGNFAGSLTNWAREVYDTATATGTIFGTARVTDLDNDGRKEFCFAYSNTSKILFYEATAPNTYTRYEWNASPGSTFLRTTFSLTQADLDRNGTNELLFGRGATPTDLYVISGVTDLTTYDSTKVYRIGRISNRAGTTINEFRGLTSGDVDGDNRTDIFMNNGGQTWRAEYRGTGSITDSASYDWTIVYKDTTGGTQLRWVTFVGDVWARSMSIGGTDMDGDGKKELLIANQRGGNAGTGATKVVILENDVISSVEISSDGNVAATYRLEQNYPNPFNPNTTIKFRLSRSETVLLEVFDIAGRRVATLVNDRVSDGEHAVVFDAKNLSSGTYVYTLKVAGHVLSQKMTLVK
ncbi:MAG: T9SS type A sorting domain-containing protein, partial [Bacteroidota bacterium]